MGNFNFIQVTLLATALAGNASAAGYPNEFWVNDQQGWVVETKPCNSGLCGYLVDFPAAHTARPDGPKKDVHNPDPTRRDFPLCGLLLMGGFRPSTPDPKVLKDGWVYDPDSGNTYSGTITMSGENTITLRGYVGIALFGKTLNLHRVAEVPAPCSVTG